MNQDLAALQRTVAALGRDLLAHQQYLAGVDAQLQATNQAQTAALTAQANRIQRATIPLTNLAVGVTPVQVPWPTVWPDTGYGVFVSIISGGPVEGTLFASILSGSKAVDSCTVNVANTGLNIVASTALDVLGIHGN